MRLKKNLRLTAKDLKKSLELVNISVHVSTIHNTMKQHRNNITVDLKFALSSKSKGFTHFFLPLYFMLIDW